MAGKKGSTDNKAIKVLTGLSGVGAATAAKMVAAGMKTPAGVRKAGISGLVKAGISASSAKKIVAGLPKAAAKKAFEVFIESFFRESSSVDVSAL